jgi:catechol 2,3-dioxygenase-like lactoylglutathione lyase family enzyme
MARLDHLDLVVGSIERSFPFYRELLQPLGWRWVREVEGERGETIHYLFRLDGRASVGLRASQSQGAPPHDRYAVGIHHGIKVEVMNRPRLATTLWALRPSTSPFRPGNRGPAALTAGAPRVSRRRGRRAGRGGAGRRRGDR